ncbi:DGQHR domain-containing protein [uncultured Tateyamaria sp.]|uniref:DGQHR domain-containing protein n=1 Tax=uncultured Tateyamaria sp. TaxID=455651 RepID=UPI00262C7783|nr:DGQHR domain-containing protein [uncultured Tateyamaria sp.]
MKNRTKSKVQIDVLVGEVLGVKVARGFARLCDLARMSRPDIYDAKTNPTGTQRDLSPKHARDAYGYVQEEDLAFWPEVFLSLRDASHIVLKPVSKHSSLHRISVDIEPISKADDIHISRIDGNHRLHLADGKTEGYSEITKTVSFCLALEMTQDEEIKLFRDINDNQRRMNTSHLDNINVRLSTAAQLARRDPMLYIAKKLSDDADSPFFGKVYDGGKSGVTRFLPLRSLKTGLEYMFSRPTKLTALDDRDVQATVVKNYFLALKRWQPDAFQRPKEFLLLRGAGLWGACFLGAEVIDRTLADGKYKPLDMLKILESGPEWDWSKGGPFQGLSGRSGAVRISDTIVAELEDQEGVSLRSVMKRIADDL